MNRSWPCSPTTARVSSLAMKLRPRRRITSFARRASDGKQALTNFPDPTPQLRGIKKQLVRYKRKDGVDLSFTLYLPPDYKEGDAAADRRLGLSAANSTTPTRRARSPARPIASRPSAACRTCSSRCWVTRFWTSATMPVIGDPETMNNTYVEQIVASAEAAIDKAVEMGVTDRNRVGVGGHSYGAFMTANLLAHSDLFRAGIARSGAYNRTLTPFGFQSERRTFWEAPEMYFKVSPFMYANKIKEPILLIHGEADNNSGTFPIQSDRMYQAHQGQRRQCPLCDAAARIARLRRPRINRTHAVGDDHVDG